MTSLSDTPRETAAQDAAERDMDATPTPALLGPRALIWRKFRRHRLAMASLWIVGAIYLIAALGEFLAPMDPHDTSVRHTFQPPQSLGLFVTEADGSRRLQLHASAKKMELNRELRRRTFVDDPDKVVPLGFFVRGFEYKLFGVIPSTLHLFGPVNPRDRRICWAPTGLAATSSAGSSPARGCRCRSVWSGSRCRW